MDNISDFEIRHIAVEQSGGDVERAQDIYEFLLQGTVSDTPASEEQPDPSSLEVRLEELLGVETFETPEDYYAYLYGATTQTEQDTARAEVEETEVKPIFVLFRT